MFMHLNSFPSTVKNTTMFCHFFPFWLDQNICETYFLSWVLFESRCARTCAIFIFFRWRSPRLSTDFKWGNMLLLCNGKERSAKEYRQRLEKHGFEDVHVELVNPAMNVFLCKKIWISLIRLIGERCGEECQSLPYYVPFNYSRITTLSLVVLASWCYL